MIFLNFWLDQKSHLHPEPQKASFCLVIFIQPIAGPQSKPLNTQRRALEFFFR